eukprot:5079904-Lingulodinium_polyedra.AAC.1
MLVAVIGARWPEGKHARPIVLLSLFDGIGTARMALDDLLRIMRRPDAPTAGLFAEIDAKLAASVQGVWEQWAR